MFQNLTTCELYYVHDVHNVIKKIKVTETFISQFEGCLPVYFSRH
jgi:hypothetical protein